MIEKQKVAESTSQSRNNIFRQVFKTSVLVCISLILYILILQMVDIGSLFNILINVNMVYIIILVIAEFILILVRSERWMILLKKTSSDLGFTEVFITMMSGFPFIAILPGTLGDFVKPYLTKSRIPFLEASSTIIMEKMIDGLTLITLCIIGTLQILSIELNVLALIALLLIYIGVFIFPVVVKKVNIRSMKLWKIISPLESSIEDKKSFVSTLSLSFMIWVSTVIQVQLIFMMLGIDVPLFSTLGFYPLIVVASMLPISWGGMGIREFIMILLFGAFGSIDQLTASGIYVTILKVWFPAIMGIPLLIVLIIRMDRSRDYSAV
ncbi:MAG: lysylphosphatidylglycerol synthase transmembrane domain-containing protein [Candidatus Hodarchaeales archaeon]